jgi:hypothetical protein
MGGCLEAVRGLLGGVRSLLGVGPHGGGLLVLVRLLLMLLWLDAGQLLSGARRSVGARAAAEEVVEF